MYQFKKIGVNDIRAGSIHTFASIKNAVLLVILIGYSNGRTIA